MSDRTYRVEFRTRRLATCCPPSSYYWVRRGITVTAATPEHAREHVIKLYTPNGITEVIRVTEIDNENQD